MARSSSPRLAATTSALIRVKPSTERVDADSDVGVERERFCPAIGLGSMSVMETGLGSESLLGRASTERGTRSDECAYLKVSRPSNNRFVVWRQAFQERPRYPDCTTLVTSVLSVEKPLPVRRNS